jgi:hypothetical protein
MNNLRSIDEVWNEDIPQFDDGNTLVEVYFGKIKYRYLLPSDWNITYRYFKEFKGKPYSGFVYARDERTCMQLWFKDGFLHKLNGPAWSLRYGNDIPPFNFFSYHFHWYFNGNYLKEISTPISYLNVTSFYTQTKDEFNEIASFY